VKSFNPISPGKRNLNKQRANDTVNRTNNTFGFTILKRRVWTRHPKLCAFRQEKGPGVRAVKLMPVVTLDGLDGVVKMSINISKEVGQCGEGVRFKLK
jgi:hypothetical protein